MTELREGNVVWTFPDEFHANKYDNWAFYRNQFQGKSGGDTKAVDFLAFDNNNHVIWLIEAKDYTFEARNPDKEPLWQEVAKKARDTLAGLMAARANAVDDEKRFAQTATSATKIRLVLHLELPTTTKHSYKRLFDPADVLQKLKSVAKAIDPHPKVVDCTKEWGLPWTARWEPLTQNGGG